MSENFRVAVFPGSFDPFTIGHYSIVNRALPIFDKIIIAIGINNEKNYLFPPEKRKIWIEKVFDGNKKIEVDIYDILTIEYCRQRGIKYLLRGLRTSADFEYERQIAQINKSLNPDIDSVFFLTLPQHTHISSTIVREIIKYKGDVSKFVPEIIANEIHKSYEGN